jgi:hypothetical protein
MRHEGELPLPISRYDLATGCKQAWKELMPAPTARAWCGWTRW